MNYLPFKTIFQKYRPYFFILAFFIAWLLVLYLTAFFTFDKNHYQATTPWFSPTYWARWDSTFYTDIATKGYTPTTAVFYPLYPLLIIIFTLTGLNPFWAGHFISLLFFLPALFLLYKLIKLDFPPKIALWTIVFLLIFPSSFFFLSVYPTSLLLFLLIASLLAARQGHWWLSVILGLLASLTKLEGLIILPLLFFIALKQNNYRVKSFWLKLTSLLLIPVGILSYGFYLYRKFGDFFLFLSAQKYFHTSINWPPITLARYFTHINIDYHNGLKLQVIIFIFNLLLFLFLLFRLKKTYRQLSPPYILLMFFSLLFPFFGDILISFNRYLLPFFSIFLSLAMIKNQSWKIIWAVISGLLLFIFTALFINWHWVG
jgi:Gpi18-like mannosyltransferase